MKFWKLKLGILIFATFCALAAHAAGVNDLAWLNSPTVPLTATTGGANVALPTQGPAVMIAVLGSNPVWCSSGVGSGTVAAASTGNSAAIPSGAIETFRIDPQATYVACMSTGGNSLVSVSVVQGQ